MIKKSILYDKYWIIFLSTNAIYNITPSANWKTVSFWCERLVCFRYEKQYLKTKDIIIHSIFLRRVIVCSEAIISCNAHHKERCNKNFFLLDFNFTKSFQKQDIVILTTTLSITIMAQTYTAFWHINFINEKPFR